MAGQYAICGGAVALGSDLAGGGAQKLLTGEDAETTVGFTFGRQAQEWQGAIVAGFTLAVGFVGTPKPLTGNVKLYHHTSSEGGLGVNQTGVLKGSKGRGLWRPWRTGDVYLTIYPELSTWRRWVYGLEKSRTAAVVPVTLPAESVQWGPFGIAIHRGDIILGPPQDF